MAKTIATLTQESILANIDGKALKAAFKVACAVAKGEQEEGALAAHASDVHALQALADKFADLGKAISDTVKAAEGVYYAKHGDVTDGFKLKNIGYTTTVRDFAGFKAAAEQEGANMALLDAFVKITPKDAAKWLGLSDERFEATFGEYLEKKKKADSLVRAF